MQNTRFTCDICGAEKGAANHWFIVTGEDDAFIVEPWEEEQAVGKYEHICGQECLHKRLSQWLEANTN